jgi:hypothetical protein
MRTRTLVLIVIVAAALLLAGVLAFGPMTGGSSSENTYNESPVGLMSLTRNNVNYHKGTIKHHHHGEHTKQTKSRRSRSTLGAAAAGACYVTDRDEWGDSGTFAKVTRGTVHYHWCVGRKNPAKIVSYWTSFDSWAWVLQRWHINDYHVSKESPILWTSTWCTPNGSGPCFNVQRKTLEYHFQFIRHVHIPILGWDIDQHADFYIICTVRGDSPGAHANHECYSDMT